MNILLVNQNWFKQEFQTLGHRVLSYGQPEWLDVRQVKPLVAWPEVLAALPSDFKPDLLIVYDNSSPIVITHLETIDIPSVFYSVDIHHHFAYHSYLGLVFDNIFVAQKDYAPEFHKIGIQPHWLPLWASVSMEPMEPKTFGAVFLGTLDPLLNPDRVRFFDELKKLVEIDVRTAPFPDVFPRSQIIVNQTVKGDLNFRVFEAMMSGALLLTERSGNGLNELFKEDVHLVLYEKGNAAEAGEKISYYLAHPEEARKIGLAGRDIICSQHLPMHRAQQLLEALKHPTRPNKIPSAFAAMRNYTRLIGGLNCGELSPWGARASLEVMRLAHLGLANGEALSPVLAVDLAYGVYSLRNIIGEEKVQTCLDEFRQVYPDLVLFHLVKIDQLVKAGQRTLAEALAQGVSELPLEDTFKKAEEVVRELQQ